MEKIMAYNRFCLADCNLRFTNCIFGVVNWGSFLY